MCGIIGYTGKPDVTASLIGGLEKLEYRGYDSAGIALAVRGGISVIKSVGRISQLTDKLKDVKLSASCGIVCATSGKPAATNNVDKIVLVFIYKYLKLVFKNALTA